ncbi:hypothetical protein O3P69_003075 [Scylla paramamosain]|uniref:Uncharacterized protein n=1 Tax=Scylla paramamosain TaxID=85552 RepID=A0AAW0UJU8_SCYPA
MQDSDQSDDLISNGDISHPDDDQCFLLPDGTLKRAPTRFTRLAYQSVSD